MRSKAQGSRPTSRTKFDGKPSRRSRNNASTRLKRPQMIRKQTIKARSSSPSRLAPRRRKASVETKSITTWSTTLWPSLKTAKAVILNHVQLSNLPKSCSLNSRSASKAGLTNRMHLLRRIASVFIRWKIVEMPSLLEAQVPDSALPTSTVVLKRVSHANLSLSPSKLRWQMASTTWTKKASQEPSKSISSKKRSLFQQRELNSVKDHRTFWAKTTVQIRSHRFNCKNWECHRAQQIEAKVITTLQMIASTSHQWPGKCKSRWTHIRRNCSHSSNQHSHNMLHKRIPVHRGYRTEQVWWVRSNSKCNICRPMYRQRCRHQLQHEMPAGRTRRATCPPEHGTWKVKTTRAQSVRSKRTFLWGTSHTTTSAASMMDFQIVKTVWARTSTNWKSSSLGRKNQLKVLHRPRFFHSSRPTPCRPRWIKDSWALRMLSSTRPWDEYRRHHHKLKVTRSREAEALRILTTRGEVPLLHTAIRISSLTTNIRRSKELAKKWITVE